MERQRPGRRLGARHIDVATGYGCRRQAAAQDDGRRLLLRPTTDPECVFSQFSIAWQFDNYIMSFANGVFPRPNFADPKAPDIEGWGVYFYGSNGTLQVNRMGWALGASRPDP
jgi:hypothetical protein